MLLLHCSSFSLVRMPLRRTLAIMRFSLFFMLALSLVSVPAYSFVLRDIPVATAVRHDHSIDQIPQPTPAPEYELRRRQAATQRTLLGAPDNTCGYIHESAYLLFKSQTYPFADAVNSSTMGLLSRIRVFLRNTNPITSKQHPNPNSR